VRQALDPPSAVEGEADTAVLVPLVPIGSSIALLYTRRAEHLSSHPGEVSFPGGWTQPDDPDAVAAALREAREEVGLRAEDVAVLGHVGDVPTLDGRTLRALAGRLSPTTRLGEPVTPGEVAERLLVPLEGLRTGEAPVPEVPAPLDELGRAHGVQGYEARSVEQEAREAQVVHYWHLAEDTTVWGLTGAVTAELMGRAFGWSPPSAPRSVRRDDVRP
jgi:8-oxo-dGTP pyrophosphatase MutT (NUDIX family)